MTFLRENIKINLVASLTLQITHSRMNDLQNLLRSNAPGRYKLEWGGDSLQPIRYKINTTKQTAVKYNAMWTSAITKITQCKYVNLKKYIRMNVPHEDKVVTISIFPTATVMFQGKVVTNWAAQYLERICREVEEQIDDQKQELDLIDESDVSNHSTPVKGICAICDLEDGEMILCDYCFASTHLNCAGVTESQKSDALYYCKHCKFKYGLTDYTITVNSSTPIKDHPAALKIDSSQIKDTERSYKNEISDITAEIKTEKLELHSSPTKPTQSEITHVSNTDEESRSTNNSELDELALDHHRQAMDKVAGILKNLSLVQIQTASHNLMLDGLTGRLKNAEEIIDATSTPVAPTEIENHELYGEDKANIIKELIHLERVRRKTEVHLIEARMEKESSDLNLLKALAEKEAIEYKLKEIEVVTTNLVSSMYSVSYPMPPGPTNEEIQQLKEVNCILSQDNIRLKDTKKHLYGMIDAAKERIESQTLKEQQLHEEIDKLRAALRLTVEPSSEARRTTMDHSTQSKYPPSPRRKWTMDHSTQTFDPQSKDPPSPNHPSENHAKSKTSQPPKQQRNPSAPTPHWLPATESSANSKILSPPESIDIEQIQTIADIHHPPETDSSTDDQDSDSTESKEPFITSKDIHRCSDRLPFISLHSRFTPKFPDKIQDFKTPPLMSLHSRFTPKYPDEPLPPNISDKNLRPLNSSLYNGYQMNNQHTKSTPSRNQNPWTMISPNHQNRNWKPVCKNYVQDKCFSKNCIYYHPKNVIRTDRRNDLPLITRRFELLSDPDKMEPDYPRNHKLQPHADRTDNRTSESNSYNPYHAQSRNSLLPNPELHTAQEHNQHILDTSERHSNPYSYKEKTPPPVSPESIGSYLQRLSKLVDERSRLLDMEELHSRPICKYYIEGRCKYGDRLCFNRHPNSL